ncbi:crotonobetainyl-CoA:carnitine CoA-transferase CaiB-like acyl-CoA transferase [Bradyrhizobium sp. GM24.11]
MAANPENRTTDPSLRPLNGVVVIDFTHVLAGPFCTTILADLGAEVIKIERLGAGDICRTADPFRAGESYFFTGLHRNKRSVALDLKRDAARQVIEGLVKRADVLVENFRPGALEALGFGYDRLHQLNPKLVVCSISGFGQNGPLKEFKSFDLVAQAMTGIMSLTGEPGRPPVRAGVHIGDILVGVYGAVAISAALVGRAESGRGSILDLSLFESLLSTFPYLASRYLADGELFSSVGSGDFHTVPWGAFPASDGYLVIAVYGDHMWPELCRAIGIPEIGNDPGLLTNAGRVERRHIVDTALVEALKTKTVAEWCAILAAANIPASPILNVGQALTHPHTIARDMILEFEHSKAGPIKAVRSPIHINGHSIPPSVAPGPMLGEHTDDVLKELGYDAEWIGRLRAEGSIGS